MGGYYGAGARRGGDVSHFLVGVKKDDDQFYSFGRLGSGYSDIELRVRYC